MAEGHCWGCSSRAGSNHRALASDCAAPPYPRRGALSRTYVAVYRGSLPFSKEALVTATTTQSNLEQSNIIIDEITCKDYYKSSHLEWLETNGLGSFASGTVSGANT